jgi:uncharacterized protein YggU (UPF0235/DUF167 family)
MCSRERQKQSWRVRTTACSRSVWPPVDGAANAALVEFIASRLKIAKNRARVVAGLASRRKWVEIVGLEAAAIEAALRE